MSKDDRLARRKIRTKAHVRGGVEGLESRELMAYSAFGYSLPDLTVTGFSGLVGSRGEALSVTVDVQNLGAASLPEPDKEALIIPEAPAPPPVSPQTHADAGPSVVRVRMGRPGASFSQSIPIGDIQIPRLPENDIVRVTSSITLPPTGIFPKLPTRGPAVLYFMADANHQVVELDEANNRDLHPFQFTLAAPLPDVNAIAMSNSQPLRPGDLITNDFKLVNSGTVNTNTQQPFFVDLVRSNDLVYQPGRDEVLARYQIGGNQALSNIQPSALASRKRLYYPTQNLTDLNDIATVISSPVNLPFQPNSYYIGLVVDPTRQLTERGETRRTPIRLTNVKLVTGANSALPPADVLAPPPIDPTATFPYRPR